MGEHARTGTEWLSFCEEHGLTETREIAGYEVTRMTPLGEEFLDFLAFMEGTILACGRTEKAIEEDGLPE